MSLPPAIFIMGPTAAGKTDLAFQVYDSLPVEIISVDSALIYRGMDIGTAKPDEVLLQRYPHRLVNIIEPTEVYSAARFRNDVLAAMSEITAAGRIPLLVGGTMLYFRALEHGLSELPPADPEIRTRLDAEIEEKGLQAMHQRLAEIDPDSAQRIHPNDPQRIQRALEVYEITGKSMTALYAEVEVERLPYHLAKIIIAPQDRSVLHQRIEQRFLSMLDQGFIEEVATLRSRGDLDLTLPSMRAVGYRQVWEYLDGQYDYEEMVKRGVVATRQFAKRQLTWLRAEETAARFESDGSELLYNVLKYIDIRLGLSRQ